MSKKDKDLKPYVKDIEELPKKSFNTFLKIMRNKEKQQIQLYWQNIWP